MSIRPRWLALLLGLWGVAVVLLARDGPGGSCPLGSCPACGACYRPPAIETAEQETRVA